MLHISTLNTKYYNHGQRMSEHQMHFSIVAHKYPESADHGRQLHYTAVGVFAGHFAANPYLEEEIMN